MKLLLDTHALLWWLGDPDQLAVSARQAIESASSEVFVSSASLWEMSIKQALGKLKMPGNPLDAVHASGFRWLDIRSEHAWKAGTLRAHHRDPFDRMLVAQAEIEQLVLVTRDSRLSLYGIAVLPA